MDSRSCPFRELLARLSSRSSSTGATLLLMEAGASRHRRWSEPGGQRVGEFLIGSFSRPANISVGPDQHGTRSRYGTENRKLPFAGIDGVDPLDTVRPWRDIESICIPKIEQQRPGTMQQREHA